MSRAFPGFEQLYIFSDPLANSPFRGEFIGVDHRAINQLARGERQPEHPAEVVHAMGGKPHDVIWTTSAGTPIISDRVVRLLEESSFTGWRTYPINLHDHGGSLVAGYHGLAITGRCGPVDFKRSVPFQKEYPTGRFTAYRGLHFAEETWDGSDFFVPINSGYLFLVEAVRRVLEKNHIRNVRLIAATEFELESWIVERGSLRSSS